MENLLFLVHRLPYPPNKGDKIRSFNLLKYLSSRYRVYLGTFIDDPHDLRYVAQLEQWCQEVHVERIHPRWRKLASVRGLFQRQALSLPYYRNRRLASWVREKLATDAVKRVVIYSSTMAQYVSEDRYKDLQRIADFVDVDSEKWRQYSDKKVQPLKWMYRREGKELLRFEREAASRFDAVFFVSKAEADLFRSLAPEVAAKIHYYNNGVDTGFFSPDGHYDNPYPPDELSIVFTGAMDYWANADAVRWFAREVFPNIRSASPRAKFYVVGARPTEHVLQLRKHDGVEVVGAVRDIRPYLGHARFAVAPLRVARGIQNKVLEAMAMAKPVLATPAAMEGLVLPDEFAELVSDDAEVLAARSVELLNAGDAHGLGQRGRDFVDRNYSWDLTCRRLEALFHGWENGAEAMRLSA